MYILDFAHLIQRPSITKKSRYEVPEVQSYLLNERPPHLCHPNGLRGVELTEEYLAELDRTMVLKEVDHCLMEI